MCSTLSKDCNILRELRCNVPRGLHAAATAKRLHVVLQHQQKGCTLLQVLHISATVKGLQRRQPHCGGSNGAECHCNASGRNATQNRCNARQRHCNSSKRLHTTAMPVNGLRATAMHCRCNASNRTAHCCTVSRRAAAAKGLLLQKDCRCKRTAAKGLLLHTANAAVSAKGLLLQRGCCCTPSMPPAKELHATATLVKHQHHCNANASKRTACCCDASKRVATPTPTPMLLSPAKRSCNAADVVAGCSHSWSLMYSSRHPLHICRLTYRCTPAFDHCTAFAQPLHCLQLLQQSCATLASCAALAILQCLLIMLAQTCNSSEILACNTNAAGTSANGQRERNG